jgi:hypothetical protein
MTIIYTVSAILLSFAVVCGFRIWRKLGEPIRPPLVRLMDREYTPAPKPAPTIVAMNRVEPMGKRKKTRKQPRRKVVHEFDQ